MTIFYVVMAQIDYEGGSPIFVTLDLEKAMDESNYDIGGCDELEIYVIGDPTHNGYLRRLTHAGKAWDGSLRGSDVYRSGGWYFKERSTDPAGRPLLVDVLFDHPPPQFALESRREQLIRWAEILMNEAENSKEP